MWLRSVWKWIRPARSSRTCDMKAIPSDIIDAAQRAQAKWLVPSAVSIAQWALESDYGAHEPPGSNNPFGIKATAGQDFVEAATHEVVGGKSVATTAKFAKYSSVEEAFDKHGELLATHKVYQPVMAMRMNADNFAQALTGIYATDPEYGTKLRQIMTENNLYIYDHLSPIPTVKPVPPVAPVSPVTPPVSPPEPVITVQEEPQHPVVDPAVYPTKPIPAPPAPPAAPLPAPTADLLSAIDMIMSGLSVLMQNLPPQYAEAGKIFASVNNLLKQIKE